MLEFENRTAGLHSTTKFHCTAEGIALGVSRAFAARYPDWPDFSKMTKEDVEKALGFLPEHHALSVRWYLIAAGGAPPAGTMLRFRPTKAPLKDRSFLQTGQVPRDALRSVALQLDLDCGKSFRVFALTCSGGIGEADAKKLQLLCGADSPVPPGTPRRLALTLTLLQSGTPALIREHNRALLKVKTRERLVLERKMKHAIFEKELWTQLKADYGKMTINRIESQDESQRLIEDKELKSARATAQAQAQRSISNKELEILSLSDQLLLIASTIDALTASLPQSEAEIAAVVDEWKFAARVAEHLRPLIDARRPDNRGMVMAGGPSEQQHLKPIVDILTNVGLLDSEV
jgi:hypothetical protein